jgi:hypothetical protein
MHGIKVLMAKNYIDNLSKEARKGMQEKAEQGIWPTKCPLGYRNITGPEGKKIIATDPSNRTSDLRVVRMVRARRYFTEGSSAKGARRRSLCAHLTIATGSYSQATPLRPRAATGRPCLSHSSSVAPRMPRKRAASDRLMFLRDTHPPIQLTKNCLRLAEYSGHAFSRSRSSRSRSVTGRTQD